MFRILPDLALDNMDNDGDEDVENIVHSMMITMMILTVKKTRTMMMVEIIYGDEGRLCNVQVQILPDLPSEKSDVNYDDNAEDMGKK